MNLYLNEEKKYTWRFNLPAIACLLYHGFIDDVKLSEPFDGQALLIYGGKSDHVDEEQIQLMRNWIPNLELYCIPQGTHYLHVEYPNELLQSAVAFINR